MKVCLIVGAGASLANALHFHGTRKQAENPPLDLTFFHKVHDLGVTIPAELRNYSASTPGNDPFSHKAGQPATRMEAFFRELFFDFQEASPGSSTALAYEQLLELYLKVLRQTTDWIGADNRTGGPIGKLLAEAANSSDEVVIITFNHDLIIENEIFKRLRMRHLWCIEKCYGSLSSALDYTAPTSGATPLSRFFATHSASCQHKVTILKMHGSLNWYVRMRGQHPSRATLTGATAPSKINCTRRRFVPTQFRWHSSNRSGGRSRWYTWPVVVPPIHGKEGLIRTFLPQVWSNAELALQTADRIAFVGYSLPILDIHAERVIRRSVFANSNLGWDSLSRVVDEKSPVRLRRTLTCA